MPMWSDGSIRSNDDITDLARSISEYFETSRAKDIERLKLENAQLREHLQRGPIKPIKGICPVCRVRVADSLVKAATA